MARATSKRTDTLPLVTDTLPVVEERASIRKERRVRAAVNVRTVVREHEEQIDVPLEQEEVEVERVARDEWLDAPLPTRQEGDTTIIPLHEEVLVVEKRLKLVGEIRLTRRRSTVHEKQSVVLRREEAVVERIPADDPDEG